jgi:hypothetical protein
VRARIILLQETAAIVLPPRPALLSRIVVGRVSGAA